MQERDPTGPALWTVLSCSLAMALAGCSASTTTASGPSPGFQWRLQRHRVRDLGLGRLYDDGSEHPIRRGPWRNRGHARQPSASRRSHPRRGQGLRHCRDNRWKTARARSPTKPSPMRCPLVNFPGVLGMDSLAITGTLELMHPNPGVFAFSSKATNLEFAFTASDVTGGETRNGTRQLTATSTLATESNDMTTVFVKAGVPAGTLNNSIALSFTPATGDHACRWRQPLPGGRPSSQRHDWLDFGFSSGPPLTASLFPRLRLWSTTLAAPPPPPARLIPAS